MSANPKINISRDNSGVIPTMPRPTMPRIGVGGPVGSGKTALIEAIVPG